MTSVDFIVLAIFLLAFALVSKRIQSTWITAPMTFVLGGLLLRPEGLCVVEHHGQSRGEVVRLTAQRRLTNPDRGFHKRERE